MRIKIIFTIIISLIAVSTANAFEFRGFNYKWGTDRTEVIKTDSSIEDNPSTKNESEKITYIFQSELGPAIAFYFFENNSLNRTALSYKPDATNFFFYNVIKNGYEIKFGEAIIVDHKSCWLLSDDAFISIFFLADEAIIAVQYQPISPGIREEYASLVKTKKEQEAATARKATAEENLQKQAKVERRGPIIHGFYIGMPLSETVELLNEKYSTIFVPWESAEFVEVYNKTFSKLAVKPLTKKVWNSGFGPKYSLVYDKFFIYNNEILNNSGCTFKGNGDGELIEINFTAEVVNILFNVADMSAENFVQAFIDAYNIPEMEVEWGSIVSWNYTGPEGFKITIDGNKSIRIEKVAKEKERNFG